MRCDGNQSDDFPCTGHTLFAPTELSPRLFWHVGLLFGTSGER